MRRELKWNLLFSIALGLNWRSFIRGDTQKLLTWISNGDLYALHRGGSQARNLCPSVVESESSPPGACAMEMLGRPTICWWFNYFGLFTAPSKSSRRLRSPTRFLFDQRFSLPALTFIKKISWERDRWNCGSASTIWQVRWRTFIYRPTWTGLLTKGTIFAPEGRPPSSRRDS